jgi:hypothetical protein
LCAPMRRTLLVVLVALAGIACGGSSAATSTPAPVPPSAPVNVVATGGAGQISLSWSAVQGATGYLVLRSDASGGTKTQIAAPTATAYVDVGLPALATRYYVVRATSQGGTSGDSAEVSASVAAAATAAPVNLTAVASNATVTLSWNAVTDATTYEVLRATGSGAGAQIGTPATNSFSDTTVRNGTTYRYTVRAVGAGGESADSSPVSAQPFRDLCVADADRNEVLVFSAEQTANAPPSRSFGSRTGLLPVGVALDPAHQELISANATGTITSFDETASGNVAPARTLLMRLSFIVYDRTGDTIMGTDGQSIWTFDRSSSGAVLPVRSLVTTKNLRTIVLSGPAHGDRIFAADDSGDFQHVYTFQRTDSLLAQDGQREPETDITSSAITTIFAVAYDPVADEVLVSQPGAVLAFPAASNGPTAPTRILSGDQTGLSGPIAISVVAGILYVLEQDGRVLRFPSNFGANANIPPSSTLAGPSTRLSDDSHFFAIDEVNGLMAVATDKSVLFFDAAASGDVAPLREIGAAATGLDAPGRLLSDAAHRELVVANAGASATVSAYSRDAVGDVTPLRTLQVSSGGTRAADVALDVVHDEVMICSATLPQVLIHGRTDQGGAAPLRTIAGPKTQLQAVLSVGYDSIGDAVVVNDSGTIRRFARSFTDGNEAPLTSIGGQQNGLVHPGTLLVDDAHQEILVGDDAGVSVFRLLDDGDVAPVRKLLVNGGVSGLFLDPVADELFVIADFSMVQAFSRTAAGNDAPLRTILTPDSSAPFNPTGLAVCN